MTVRSNLLPVVGMDTRTRHCHSSLRSPLAHEGTETIFK
jgi:hypothetical protein